MLLVRPSFNSYLFNIFDNFTQKPYWQLKLSLLLFGFIFLTTYPRYIEILSDISAEKTFAYYFSKINSPFLQIDNAHESHASKVTFRLTVPLFAKALDLTGSYDGRSIVTLYVIQSLLAFAFLYLTLKLNSRFMDPVSSMIFTIGLSGIYLSKAFFWDYDFWFDGYAYFLILCGMVSRRKPAITIFLFLACWTDERAAVALFFVWIFHLIQENELNVPSLKSVLSKATLGKPSTMVLVAGVFYLISRFWLKYRFGLSIPVGADAGVSTSLIPYQLKHRSVGIFLTYEGMWLLFIAALFILFQLKNYLIFGLLIFSMILQITVAYSVFDITRSLTYGFPLIFIAAIVISKHAKDYLQIALLSATTLSLCIPTEYLIFYPRQIPWTIFSLPEIWSVVRNFL